MLQLHVCKQLTFTDPLYVTGLWLTTIYNLCVVRVITTNQYMKLTIKQNIKDMRKIKRLSSRQFWKFVSNSMIFMAEQVLVTQEIVNVVVWF